MALRPESHDAHVGFKMSSIGKPAGAALVLGAVVAGSGFALLWGGRNDRLKEAPIGSGDEDRVAEPTQAAPEGTHRYSSDRPPGTHHYDCRPPEGPEMRLGLRPIAAGLDRPVLVTHAPNDPRLFVLEQRGLIHVLSKNESPSVFLDIRERVLSPDVKNGNNERGLLGLAFHPEYSENGIFYLHYSSRETSDRAEGSTIIAEFHVSSEPNVANESERVVLQVEQPYSNHNGGTIAFGSDGYLYIGLGDGGSGNDPDDNGQDPTTLLGAILRIGPEKSGTASYTTPRGNLASQRPRAAPELWDMGLRNPYRFNFDGCTGDLYIGDVGQSHWEEIDVESRGQGRRNYGWNVAEGRACRGQTDASACNVNVFTPPVHTYPNVGGASVTGGTVYRGAAIPALRGSYVFADYQTNQVWTFRWDPGTQSVSGLIDRTPEVKIKSPSSVQNGFDGEIYMTSLEGGLYQLIAQ